MTDHRIAIIVDPSLSLGVLANTVAAIGIGLGAAEPGFGGVVLTSAAGQTIHTSSNRPIPILQASAEAIRQLLLAAQEGPEEAKLVAFPQFARSLHSFEDYQQQFPTRDLANEVIDGLGLAGPAKWVKSLTGSLKLLR